ncbi:E3 ubiquitin-protein ligase TRIM39-like [Hyla sarda]|uniref:E3 ubiquitin-protein ligase TRIM39-like n=1 Tax=Hyla sarda TaxID=327740 RepID=UPI0024C2A68A|nr:E3 ubiquitin-protein ligase TRIM39-like [Hyla sarda]
MASADLREELSCSICLNVYTDPVNLRCGHNFCRECITLVLDKQRGSGAYSCPNCRATSKKRPQLQKNIALSNITRSLKSNRIKEVVSGVMCTYCVHSQVPAVKSCLLCEASLCDDHLRVHSKAAEHVLSEPTANPESRKCSIHKKILEYYCSEDSTCVCVSCCLVGEHKGHQVETLDEAFKKKKEKMKEVLEEMNSKIKEADERIPTLQEHARRVTVDAAAITERVNLLFTDVKKRIEVVQRNVLENILLGVKFAQIEVSDLQRKRDELFWKTCLSKKVSGMSDPLAALLELRGDYIFHTDHDDIQKYNVPDLNVPQISEYVQTRIHDTIKNINVRLFLMDPVDLLLDMDTSAPNVRVSEDLRTVSWSETFQNLPETPERFEKYQILSTMSFSSGQHYWEVETSKNGAWRIGVCYPSIERKGADCIIGDNKKSWSLSLIVRHAVVHDHQAEKLYIRVQSHKYGIYLDYEAGQLSFYELGDPIQHIHTFTATFTEPLYPAFYVSACRALDFPFFFLPGTGETNDVWIKIGKREKPM